jgi:hypothetical protein
MNLRGFLSFVIPAMVGERPRHQARRGPSDPPSGAGLGKLPAKAKEGGVDSIQRNERQVQRMNAKQLPDEKKASCLSADERRAELYRAMSPAKKWSAWKRLQCTAWRMKTAGVRAKHPTWSEREVEKAVREIFLYAVT